jgi:hypothetical protein
MANLNVTYADMQPAANRLRLGSSRSTPTSLGSSG